MAETVPVDILLNLAGALKELDAGAARAIGRAVYGMLGGDAALLSETVLAIFEAAADAAASYAANMYDEVREFETGRALPASPGRGFGKRAVGGYVPTVIDKALERGAQAVAGELARRLSYETRRAAGACIIANSRADPARPRFARVPTGTETCEFCIMLASRGWVYHSKKSAGALEHWHAGCDCIVVPQFDPSYAVAGYDPDFYLDIYLRNTAYKDDYGTIDTRGTLANIRREMGRDEGYYEAHRAERHAYYERTKEARKAAGRL